MVLDVIFNKLLPTTMGFLAFAFLWAIGEREGAIIALSVAFLLQVFWLLLHYKKL